MTGPALHPDTSSTVYSLQGLVLKFDTLESIQPYLDQLATVENLEEVRFGGNTLGVEACQGVAKVLESKKSLKIADFSDIFTGRLISEIPQSLRALCTALLTLPALVSVDLSDNAFGGRSAEPMLELIANAPALQVLKLNNNGMGPQGGEMIAGALYENAQKAQREGKQSSLQVLVCGRNRLENGSAPAFAKAFAALQTLKEVRMPQNGIRMEGIEAIVTGLQQCKGLEYLDLQDNTATEKGSRAIAKSLPSWPSLHTLNLSDCLLRPRGGLSIMNTLLASSSPKLATLKLQSNELSAPSILVLAQVIDKFGDNLQLLELNGNYGQEDDECYVKVREALAKHDKEDILDELDELEEFDEDEEEEEEEEEEDEDDKEEEAPAKKQEDGDLADLMNKVHIK
ncbi:GTPase-activating protein RNA1 [Sporobolomyces koalae]|uniref:GTPase-activating protein RNA1 n=1 Tax=Sporobolomyces koalae TaxID=500713 RepID=UPI00318157CB